MTTTTTVSIPTADGTTLRGDLYLPEHHAPMAPVPGVVMSHGFSATRFMSLPPFAEAMADAGLAVCLYDHRGLGESDGEPRQLIDPWRQTLDMADVVGWLADRPEVDAGRLGLWGSSFSGGEVMVLGAVDQRVRAVVANAPFAGLGDGGGEDPDARYAAIEAVLSGATPVPEPHVIGPMAVVAEPGGEEAAFMPQPESWEWFRANGPGTGWENHFTLHMTADPPFDPFVCVDHISPAALLMVVATADTVAPAETARAAFERAGEPKRLVTLDGHHFCDYQGDDQATSCAAMVEFLVAAL